MRALAALLGMYAEDVAMRADDVSSVVAALRFESPAAERFRAGTDATRAGLVTQAGRLLDVAALVVRAAAQVDTEQAARARLE